jgi:hypothetical protein
MLGGSRTESIAAQRIPPAQKFEISVRDHDV